MGWLSHASTDTTSIDCPSCGHKVCADLPRADHHPVACSSCEKQLFVFSATKATVAVDMTAAPPELSEALGWMQKNFDELEFVTFLVSFEEMVGLSLSPRQTT